MLDIHRIKSFEMPTRIITGVGCRKELVPALEQEEVTKPLIVTDEGIIEAGLLEKITCLLEEKNIEFEVYSEVEANPDIETVDQGCDIFQEKGCDGLIALGGGSSIDTAKGIGVLDQHGGSIKEYEFGQKPLQRRITSLIALPTTAGTGSEVTMWAVITDHEREIKYNVGGPLIAPQVAIVDPELHVSMPAFITAETGMDALCHAIECYTSHYAQPLTDSVALLAIEYCAKYLRRATANSQDLEARYYMAQAATLAGLSYGSESAGAVHAMAQSLAGIKPEIRHGAAVGALLAPVMEYNWLGRPEKFSRIAEAMEENVWDLTNKEAAIAGIEAIRGLVEDIGIPSLRELGITRDEIPELAQAAEDDPQTVGNPRDVDKNSYKEIYHKALKRK
ncbi:iron-containing alcohol dehydrogenase [Halarsenatibacter silvermanii]|uniref:Choline dehydrogenase n=1 Tax=Halarsenatibacter silvermanii TaxID=321763 RepID=A0A1G9NJV5_9FIRM|nr:iron-containing alcohol dehydrogenase [Halarsenatibacter silvermanii]SDL86858.1 choline dehydrogenase [Halarsenatibacter silvermanii]